MAEEIKKKHTTTTKKVNNKKKPSTAKKGNNQNNKKKPVNKNKQTTKKQQPKKVAPKKVELQKKQPKKVEEPNVEKTVVEEKPIIKEPIVTKEIEKEIENEVEIEEESILEKTLIFDGRENKNLSEVGEKLEEENVVLEDKVIKRSKGKKIAVIILTILIFVTIIGTIIYAICSESNRANANMTLNSNIYDKVSKKYDSTTDIDAAKLSKEEDQGIEEYKNLTTISLGDFEKKILAKEDMTVLITSTTCYYCAQYEPIVNEVYGELNKKIYRLNITALTKKEVDRFRTYYAFTDVPTIFVLKDGVVNKDIIGSIDKETLINWIENN